MFTLFATKAVDTRPDPVWIAVLIAATVAVAQYLYATNRLTLTYVNLASIPFCGLYVVVLVDLLLRSAWLHRIVE
jgi:hypothetical protein